MTNILLILYFIWWIQIQYSESYSLQYYWKVHADKPQDGLVLKFRQTRNQLTHKKAALKKSCMENLCINHFVTSWNFTNILSDTIWFQVTQVRVRIRTTLVCEETIVSLYNFLNLHVCLKLKRTVLRSGFLQFLSLFQLIHFSFSFMAKSLHYNLDSFLSSAV